MKTQKTSYFFKFLLCALIFVYALDLVKAQGNPNPAPVPIITSITPSSGKVGDVVTINGDNFSATPANNVVFFGGVKATVNTASLTTLQVVVPAGASSLSEIRVGVGTTTKLYTSSLKSNNPFFNLRFDNGTITNSTYDTIGYKTTLSAPPDGGNELETADLNNDGKLDIIAPVDRLTKTAILYRNATNTGYDAPFIISTRGSHATTADFNNDGKLDIALCGYMGNTSVTILLRNNNNTDFDLSNFSLATSIQQTPTSFAPYAIKSGDFNNDGNIDLVIISFLEIFVYIGAGNGNFQLETKINTGGQNVVIADFNQDGSLDLAVGSGGKIRLYYRNANLSGFNAPEEFVFDDYVNDIDLGDFNNDGKLDIVAAVFAPGGLMTPHGLVLLIKSNTTLPSFNKINLPTTLISAPWSITTADFNGDGKIDIASSDYISSNISMFLGDGATNFFLAGTSISGAFSYPKIKAADFNGDGKTDLFSTFNFGNFWIHTYQNTNLLPTLTNLSPLTIDEDAMQQTVNLAGITDGGEGNQTLTVTATSNNTALIPNPTITYTSPNATGSLQFTPLPNINGTATITVSVNDGVSTTSKTFVVTVNPINDVPSFTKGSNPAVQINAGNQVFNNWATAINDGDTEVVQTLQFILTNDNNALFSVQPAISPTGDLTFTPATGQVGTANLTVKLRDDGSNTAPNVNESAVQNFTISVVNTNNQPPVFTKGTDPTVLEDASLQTVTNWATGIDDGDATLNQQVSFEIVGNTNAALFSVLPAVSEIGTLTYTPAPNANGTASITIRLRDNGSGVAPNVNVSANQSFNINITAVNDAPSFTKGDNISVLNAGAQSFGGWVTAINDGDPELVQNLTFELTNDNNGLFSVQPAINPNGTLTFTPATNANGVANVTVILKDNGSNVAPNINQSASQTFTITISNGINDAPTFDIVGNITIDENSGLQTRTNFATNIDDGDPEVVQALAFEISNNNNNLFSQQPTFDANGTLRFTAKPNANGTAEVSVVLVDNGAGTAPNVNRSVVKKFNINVTPVNVAPSFVINREGGNYYFSGGTQFFYYNYWYNVPLEILNYNTDGAVERNEFATQMDDGDPELIQVLTFEVTNDNNALFDVQPTIAANGKLTYTLKAGGLGIANVEVVLKDNGSNTLPNRNTSPSQSFKITVRGKNIVYIDANNNGIFDNGEFPRANTLVRINDFYCAYTNAKGEYDFYANGNYNLKVVLPVNFTSSNPATYTGNQIGWVAGKNFGLVGTPKKDVSVSLYNWFARPGFDTYYWVNFQNRGDMPQSGNISFTFDERLQYVETQYGNAPVFARNNTLTYRYQNLNPGEWKWFAIRLKIPVRNDFILGQTVIYANARINMTQGEAILVDDFPSDNSFNHCLLIRNAYDPNDKQVAPMGNISPEFVAEREAITYTIRFQNEGTAEAIRVEVRDTLSNLLDLNTLEILGSSHNFNFVLTGNQAVWHFENINLPAKKDNEAGSIGFFTFRIKPKTSVKVGDEIENRSGIYFDFNPPIITNTVKTKVVQDMEAPQIVSLSPLNNAKDVPTTKQLFFSFNERVRKGQGEIWLLEDGKVMQKLDVNSSKVTVTEEIVFVENENFSKDKTITVQLQQGSFTDIKKNVFAGLTNWTFNNMVRVPVIPTLSAKAGNRSVSLSWNSTSVDNKDISYEIYMYSAATPQRLVGSTSETSLRIEGLENGVTYFFRIKAINTYNQLESELSEAVSARPSIVLGTEDNLENIDFQAYPNPSSGKLTLAGKFKTTAQWQVVIFDLTGKKVYEQDLGKTSVLNTEIDLSAWASGMYLLRLTNDNQVISQKIVRE